MSVTARVTFIPPLPPPLHRDTLLSPLPSLSVPSSHLPFLLPTSLPLFPPFSLPFHVLPSSSPFIYHHLSLPSFSYFLHHLPFLLSTLSNFSYSLPSSLFPFLSLFLPPFLYLPFSNFSSFSLFLLYLFHVSSSFSPSLSLFCLFSFTTSVYFFSFLSTTYLQSLPLPSLSFPVSCSFLVLLPLLPFCCFSLFYHSLASYLPFSLFHYLSHTLSSIFSLLSPLYFVSLSRFLSPLHFLVFTRHC